MVRVHVGDVDLVYLLGLVACSLQIRKQITQGGAEQARCAGVHQHQLAAGVDQVGVDRGFHHLFEETALERLCNFLGRLVVHQLEHGQLDGAVGDSGDFKVTDHHPVKPGRLGLDHGRICHSVGRGDGAGEQANGQGNTGERALHVKVSFNESGRNEISGVWCAAFSAGRWHKVFDFALYRGPHPYSDWWIELLR